MARLSAAAEAAVLSAARVGAAWLSQHVGQISQRLEFKWGRLYFRRSILLYGSEVLCLMEDLFRFGSRREQDQRASS